MKIKRIRRVKMPARGTSDSAGIDFFVPEFKDLAADVAELKALGVGYDGTIVRIPPSKAVNIPSGIIASIPKHYALVALNKSGVATKKGLIVGAQVIDSDYQGEIHLHLINTTDRFVSIRENEKLVQFLLLPVFLTEIVEVQTELFDIKTERGKQGFGSTNKDLKKHK